jgi:hypothetical protein
MNDAPPNPKPESSEDARGEHTPDFAGSHVDYPHYPHEDAARHSASDDCAAAFILRLIASSARPLLTGLLARQYALHTEFRPAGAASMEEHLAYWNESYESIMGLFQAVESCDAPPVVQLRLLLSDMAGEMSSLIIMGRTAIQGSPEERTQCLRAASSVFDHCVRASKVLYDESIRLNATVKYSGGFRRGESHYVCICNGE